MKKFVSKIPLPVTLLLLSLVFLSEIMSSTIEFLGDLAMVASILMVIIVIVKIFLDFKSCIGEFNSAVGISLFSGFNMSLMLIAVWLEGIIGKFNIYVWIAGVFLQILIIIVFILKYIMNFKLKYIFPSVYLVGTGLGVSVITCRDFGMIVYGRAMFMLILCITVIVTPFVIFRIFKRPLTDAARPLVSLISVPVSTILMSYIVVSENIVNSRVWTLFVLVQLAFLITVVLMVASFFEGYFSSWSSYALSSSIATMATYRFNEYMKISGKSIDFINYLFYLEFLVSVAIFLVVMITYLINIFEEPEYHKKRVSELDNKVFFSKRRKKTDKKTTQRNDESLDKKVEKMEEGILTSDMEAVSEKELPKLKNIKKLTPEEISQNTEKLRVIIDDDDDLLG